MKSIIRFILTCVLFVVFSAIALRSEFVQGPTITSNFEDKAPHFHVLGFKNGDYEILTLSQAINSNDQFRFHLRATEHRVELGDQSFAELLYEDDGKQRIRVFYNNTYMSESIYEVVQNNVTPLKYQILGSIAYAGVYLIVIAVSLAMASLLSKGIIWTWDRRRTGNENI